MDLVPKEYKKNSDIVPPPNGKASFGADNLKLSNFSPAAGGRTRFLKLGQIVALVLLVLSLASWGGLRFYQKSVRDNIEKLKAEQANIFSPEEKEIVEKIADLEKRANLAQEFLKAHVYTSEILDLIANSTLPKVKWDSYSLNVKDSTVNLKGRAADYSILAKQIFTLKRVDNFSKIAVAGISLGNDGTVGFTIGFEFNPKILQK